MKRKELIMNTERLVIALEEPLRKASKSKFGCGLEITYVEYKLFEQLVESAKNLTKYCRVIQILKDKGKPF